MELFINKNAFEYVICEIEAIFSGGDGLNALHGQEDLNVLNS